MYYQHMLSVKLVQKPSLYTGDLHGTVNLFLKHGVSTPSS